MKEDCDSIRLWGMVSPSICCWICHPGQRQTRGNTEIRFKHIAVLYVAKQTNLHSTYSPLNNKMFLCFVWLILNKRPMLSKSKRPVAGSPLLLAYVTHDSDGSFVPPAPHNPGGQDRNPHWCEGRTAGIWKQAPHLLHALQGLTRTKLIDMPGFSLC